MVKRPGSEWHKRRIACNLYELQQICGGKVITKRIHEDLFGHNCYYAMRRDQQEGMDVNLVDTDKEMIKGVIVAFASDAGKYIDWPHSEKETNKRTGIWGIVKTR